MKRRGFLVVSCLVALAVGAGVYSYARNQAGSYRIIQRGGRSFFGNVGVSSGNLFLESGKPGILFGTVAKPGTQEEFSYVLVFRHAFSAADLAESEGLKFPIDAGTSGKGTKQESFGTITINGKRIEAKYVVNWNETFTEVASETFTAGGRPKDLTDGNVFLVDLGGPEPVYLQKNLKEMPSLGPSDSHPDVQRLAEALLKTLANADEETKKFIK